MNLIKKHYAKLSGVAIGLLAPLASFAQVVADPEVASTVDVIGETYKVNALSMLEAAIPWVVGITIVFLAYKFINRKMKGASR